jgi:hypothetical protein
MLEVTTELREQVVIEAGELRQFTTSEERSKLNYDDFQPDNGSSCIYGLLTGNYLTDRARSLIIQCSQKVLIPTNRYYDLISTAVFSNEKPESIGERIEIRYGGFYSPIEQYVLLETDQEKIKSLIAYLKRETNVFNP